jgi:hypothetical protein
MTPAAAESLVRRITRTMLEQQAASKLLANQEWLERQKTDALAACGRGEKAIASSEPVSEWAVRFSQYLRLNYPEAVNPDCGADEIGSE